MTIREQADFIGSVLRVTGTWLGERVRSRPPTANGHVVPASVDELTPEWLTEALCRDYSSARVVGFTLDDGSHGTSTRRAITVTYNDEGQRAGLPTAIYSKSTPSLINRLLIGVTGAAGMEALFYDAIRPQLNIGAPKGYFGAWDPRTCRSMILTEDITKSRGATFGDATSMHVDREGAESMVHEMASYHGPLWEDPRLNREWAGILNTQTWQRNFNTKTRFDMGAILGARLAAEEIPDALHARRSEFRPALMRSLAFNVRLPQTLLHQDVHPGNWFRLPDGSLKLYDWQGIAKGNWALDVAYALSSSLDIEDRRAWERDLIALYLDRLAAAGGNAPSFEQAWLSYRQQMFHGFIFWTYTFLIGKVAPLQPDTHVRTLIRRTSQAILDLESIDSLKEP